MPNTCFEKAEPLAMVCHGMLIWPTRFAPLYKWSLKPLSWSVNIILSSPFKRLKCVLNSLSQPQSFQFRDQKWTVLTRIKLILSFKQLNLNFSIPLYNTQGRKNRWFNISFLQHFHLFIYVVWMKCVALSCFWK